MIDLDYYLLTLNLNTRIYSDRNVHYEKRTGLSIEARTLKKIQSFNSRVCLLNWREGK